MKKLSLKQLRIKNNLTQDELASKAYLSRSMIAKYEMGLCNISYKNAKFFSKIFNVDADEFYQYNNKQYRIKSIIELISLILFALISITLLLLFVLPISKYRFHSGEEIVYVSLFKIFNFKSEISIYFLTVEPFILTGLLLLDKLLKPNKKTYLLKILIFSFVILFFITVLVFFYEYIMAYVQVF